MNIPYCVLLILIGIALSIFGLKRFGISLAISFVAPTLVGLQLAGITNQGWAIATIVVGILIFALAKPLTYFTGWFYIAIFILIPVYMSTKDEDIRKLSTEIAMGVSVVITILVRKYLKATILGISSGYSVGLGLAGIIFNQLIDSGEILNALTVPFLIIFVFIIVGVVFQFWLVKHPLKFNKPNLKINDASNVILQETPQISEAIREVTQYTKAMIDLTNPPFFKSFQNLRQKDFIKIGIAFVMLISFFFSWFVYKASYSLSVHIPLLGSYSGGISENGLSVVGINIGQCMIVLIVSIGALILCFSRFKYLSLLGLLNIIVAMIILLWWHDNVLPNLSFSVGNDNLHAEAGIHAAFGLYLFIIASIAFTIYSYEPSMLSVSGQPNNRLNSYLVPASITLITMIVLGGIYFAQTQTIKSPDNSLSAMVANAAKQAEMEQKAIKQQADAAINNTTPPVNNTVPTTPDHSNDVAPANNNIQPKEPVMDNIIGEWKGAFGKNQLSLVIQEMSIGNVSGFDKVKDATRKLIGTYSPNNGDYFMNLNEPGDNEWDGHFSMKYDHTSKTITGTWNANNGKLSRDFTLTK